MRPPSAQAQQVDPNINKTVWKEKYHVLDAQINEQAPYTGWLSKDDDGDGVTNGDEMAAGTNPFFKAPGEPHFKITNLGSDATTLQLTFPTIAGKLYQAESKVALSDATWSAGSLPSLTGDGSVRTLTVPKSAGAFFHLHVSDQASQNDGVSDWAKQLLGFATSMPVNAQSSYVSSTLSTALTAQQNVLTLTASKPTATQPLPGSTASDLGTITLTRDGYFLFSSITVPLQISVGGLIGTPGVAEAGVDYQTLPASVTFPAGVKTVVLNVTPTNSAQTAPKTITVTALPGGGYTLGASVTGCVSVYPCDNTVGTGLTGAYFSTSSATYNSPLNFGAAAATYFYTKSTATTGTAVVTYSGTPAVAFAAGGKASLQFTSGNLLGGLYDLSYLITAVNGKTLTVAISGAAVPATGTGNVTLLPFAAATVTRLDPTLDFTWNTGQPASGTWTVTDFSAKWDGYIKTPAAPGRHRQLHLRRAGRRPGARLDQRCPNHRCVDGA